MTANDLQDRLDRCLEWAQRSPDTVLAEAVRALASDVRAYIREQYAGGTIDGTGVLSEGGEPA